MTTPTEKDLLALRELTRMSGLLNNVQLYQIKMWLHVILCANNAAVEFDPDGYVLVAEISNLDYKIMMEGVSSDIVSHFKKRLMFFDKAVKMLLGDEYAVVIKMKDQILAEFPPLAAPSRTNPPRKE